VTRASASSGLPTVDVIMSTLNEERYIGRCLKAILSQDYPPELLRIWLIDGGSSDGTVEVARDIASANPGLTIVADGTRRNLPEALNLALEGCSGELVAKVDAHGYPAVDFIRRAVEALVAGGPAVACVGGRPLQEGETPFGQALAVARGSHFGVGGSVYASRATCEFVDTVQCGVYRRAALDSVGHFNPLLVAGEDEELNWRLSSAGYKILLDTRVRFHYVARSSWRAAFRQYRGYGRARVSVIALHPKFLRPRHLAPPALVAGVAAMGLASPVVPIARRGLGAIIGAYALGACIAGSRAVNDVRRASAPGVAGAFVALHLGYGVGFLLGLKDLPNHAAKQVRRSA
jgi:succinoglycan biosynthesis protein ExoA